MRVLSHKTYKTYSRKRIVIVYKRLTFKVCSTNTKTNKSILKASFKKRKLLTKKLILITRNYPKVYLTSKKKMSQIRNKIKKLMNRILMRLIKFLIKFMILKNIK